MHTHLIRSRSSIDLLSRERERREKREKRETRATRDKRDKREKREKRERVRHQLVAIGKCIG